MFENYEKHCTPEKCEFHPATGFQTANVCVPVSIEPFAKTGKVTTFCCGEPVVCSDTTKCPGKINEKCEFTISQKICVKVPVEFGARTDVGKAFISACEASSKDICHNCKTNHFYLD